LLNTTDCKICVVDNLTYAGYTDPKFDQYKNYSFYKEDIANHYAIEKIFNNFLPNIVFHLAAESHVDNSIKNPGIFIKTNVQGTLNLLQTSVKHNISLFCHVSTDEVYGDLTLDQSAFTEQSNYNPSSPYSASKASADHLARAWHRTYNLPVIITNCSNNYGPRQHSEKLIPKIICNYLQDKTIPIYGTGKNIRNWLYVEDHVNGLLTVAEQGSVGETYNIGSDFEITNLELAHRITSYLNTKTNNKKDLIRFVDDRPGHDFRYSLDYTKIANTLNWHPTETFDSGIIKTIDWYVENQNHLLIDRQSGK
jgi:dTDP-glucose 4,6-dehydratase